MVDESIVQRAAQCLLKEAPRGSMVILFGSHARGQARPDSDLDFLVVEPEVRDRLAEAVRLRAALQGVLGSHLGPVDMVVVNRERFEYWSGAVNTLYHEAAREGRIYESAA